MRYLALFLAIFALPALSQAGSIRPAAVITTAEEDVACKDALWSVLCGLVDTLAGHPQVATAPLLRWAADQCEDQPAQLPPACTTEQLQERAGGRKDVKIFTTIDEWAAAVLQQAKETAVRTQAQRLRTLAESKDAAALAAAAKKALGQ